MSHSKYTSTHLHGQKFSQRHRVLREAEGPTQGHRESHRLKCTSCELTKRSQTHLKERNEVRTGLKDKEPELTVVPEGTSSRN